MNAWQLLALAGALMGGTLALLLRRRLDRFRRRARARTATQAEQEARRLLREAGYRVLGEQVRTEWTFLVDGQQKALGLRADFIVEGHGRRYVAEVKSTPEVARLEHGPTRRQLLEYRHAYAVCGVLLVDASAQRIHVVEFPRLLGTSVSRWSWFVFGAGFGIALALGLGTGWHQSWLDALRLVSRFSSRM